MAEQTAIPSPTRYALVTGANKGIGFEICKQLASKGITVILTARNEKRGIEAQERLKEFGFADNVVFHQLDVVEPSTIASLVDFIETNYGKLDILVNNAGITGIGAEGDHLIIQELVEGDATTVFEGKKPEPVQFENKGKLIETYEGAEECVETNYYGAKRITEGVIHLLKLSDSPRIVNISSIMGHSALLPNKWAKEVLTNVETLTEERVEEVVQEFLKSFKEGSLQANGWPTQLAAYKISKAVLNAYTRIMAKKYPTFCINSACPGFAQTDSSTNLGPLTAEQGAKYIAEIVLQPDGGPSGMYFYRKEAYHSNGYIRKEECGGSSGSIAVSF